MEEHKIPTIVRALQTGCIYQYHGDDKFENLTTGVSGVIAKEDAKKFFVIPLRLNQMCMENPKLVDLIKVCRTNYSNIFVNQNL